MINKEWRTSKALVTAIGDWNELELTYEDRYIGKIVHVFSPANSKYITLLETNKVPTEDIVKYIKESILNAQD